MSQIAGIGVDTVEIQRVAKAVEREHFIKRVYTISEAEYCEKKRNGRTQSYAGIFAAKEAAAKALGCGFCGFGPESIEIGHNEEGAPYLIFLNGALKKAQSLNVIRSHVSISHDQTSAIAYVILEKEEQQA